MGNDFDDYVVIISSPIHALNRTYCQPFMGDVVEENMFWLNLSQEELEDLTIRQLQAGEGVMFSCDCHPDGDRTNGYWDPDCFQYGEVLGGLTFGMTKAERLLTRESTMNHCMMFCGVNLDENGKADRWEDREQLGRCRRPEGLLHRQRKVVQGQCLPDHSPQEPAERCPAHPAGSGAPAHEAVGSAGLNSNKML